MDSRIILSTADFSANNIGRYVEMLDLTKKVLVKQTQYSEGSDEAIALNTFLVNLTTDGFIGGSTPLLKTLILPCLASQHSEILYNIAQLDGNGYPVNEMNESEIEAETKTFSLVQDSSNHVIAIKRVTNASQGEANIDSHLFPTTGVTYPAFSMIAYGAEGITTSYTNTVVNNNSLNYIVDLNTAKVRLYHENINYIENTMSGMIGNRFCGFSYVPDTEFIGLLNTGTINQAEVIGDTSKLKTQANSNVFTVGKYYTDDDRRFKYSAIAFGDGLSMTQLTTLKGYFDTLMTALYVNV